MNPYRQHFKTYREPMSAKVLFSITLVVFILLAGSLGACLDSLDDNSHEWATSEHLKALREVEEGTARRDAAAQALCTEAHGESVAIWHSDGSLICRPRRGPLSAKVQL